MPGTVKVGKLTASIHLARDPQFYAKIGAKGGKVRRTKPSGFAHMKLYHPEQFDRICKGGGRKPFTAAQKQAVRERMLAYWQERKASG